MKPMGISINRLARDIAVPPGRISEIVNGKRAITANTVVYGTVIGVVYGRLSRTAPLAM